MRLFKGLSRAKKVMLLGAATFMLTTAAILGVTAKTAMANDCSVNAIMKCGASSPSDFINNVNHKVSPDLATIYADYGLVSSDYSKFVTSAEKGYAYKNGDIKVGDRVVATDAQSIGRTHFSYAHAKVIGGKTYWESRSQDVFLVDKIPVMVLFNAKGQFQFAAMYACGNPIHGHNNNPNFACNHLIQKPVDRDTFQFSTDASAGNGATINHVVYDFGDGKTQTETNPATVVTHTYAKPGDFTAKVTVYVNVPGSQTYAIAAAGDCIKKITVKPAPEAACTVLNVTVIDRDSFLLEAEAHTANGATISSYDFVVTDDGGKTVASQPVTTTANSASTTVNLTDAGNYIAKVTVHTSEGAKTSDACQKPITVKAAPVAACENLKAIVTDRTKVALTATASAANGATISSYNFVVKNAAGTTVASPSVTTTAKTATANLALVTPGDYTAVVTVNTSLGAKTSDACQAKITIQAAPAAACVALTATMIDRDSFRLDAQASADNGATISSYDFVVTDANNKTAASANVPTTATTASTTVNLTNAGTYTAVVTVNTSLGAKTSNNCQTEITVNEAPAAACKLLAFATVDMTNFTLNAEATAVNGATVQGYDFVVKDGKSVVVASKSVDTTATTASTKVTLTNPDTYTAQVTVRTSLGQLTGPQCIQKITVPPVLTPNITIVKTVDGKKREQVNVNQNFVYQLVITNTGDIDLKNAVVTDPAPAGVTMLSTDLGTIDSNALNYTIASLKKGESVTVNITAKLPAIVSGDVVNTACVNAPEVNPDQPEKADACDTATVTTTPLPPELPKTGAGNTIAIFAGVVVAGTIGHRLFLSRKLARR